MSKLMDKQEIFCQEYLVDVNATKAAERAGYSKATANEQGSRLLANVSVSTRIAELKAERSKRTEITIDYVLAGIKEVAERCLAAKPVREWDYDEKAYVSKTDEDGNKVFEFDSQGANKAFELLGKHVGAFEKDNSQSKLKIIVSSKK